MGRLRFGRNHARVLDRRFPLVEVVMSFRCSRNARVAGRSATPPLTARRSGVGLFRETEFEIGRSGQQTYCMGAAIRRGQADERRQRAPGGVR